MVIINIKIIAKKFTFTSIQIFKLFQNANLTGKCMDGGAFKFYGGKLHACLKINRVCVQSLIAVFDSILSAQHVLTIVVAFHDCMFVFIVTCKNRQGKMANSFQSKLQWLPGFHFILVKVKPWDIQEVSLRNS